MKSIFIGAALSTILAWPLAAQNVEPLPPQGQPTQQPASTGQAAQTTTPPLPGQAAPRPYPAPTPSQTSALPAQSGTAQQAPAQLPYEQPADNGQISSPSAQATNAPATPSAPAYKPSDFTTVVDLIQQSPVHTRLAELLGDGMMVGALEELGPFTIFAPSNSAFMAMDQAELVSLLETENKATLDRLLKYHVVKGYLASSELVKQLKANGGRGSLPTLSGQTLVAGLSPEGKVTLTDPEGHVATITAYDQPAFNGLVHVTDTVMIPAEPDTGKKKRRR